MIYELALKLKNAGFRQDGVMGKIGKEISIGETISFEKGTECSVPTLSELIEACGSDFYTLRRNPADLWVAEEDNGTRNLKGHGTTPEEAVAKLWLALDEAHHPSEKEKVASN